VGDDHHRLTGFNHGGKYRIATLQRPLRAP
jgi:hypothetical protein